MGHYIRQRAFLQLGIGEVRIIIKIKMHLASKFAVDDFKDECIMYIKWGVECRLSFIEILEKTKFFWEEYGFSTWQWQELGGVYRRVTFKKDSLMGEIARYYADDYVVFTHNGLSSAQKILSQWKPIPDVMTQRVLMVVNDPLHGHQKILHKSFLFGFRGWIDVSFYCPEGDDVHRKFSDLAVLVRNAFKIYNKVTSQVEGGNVQ
ncbi:MAG: hypothetical protein PWP05_523 [Thermovirga sp.]|nr:hypothetical protein [Thermovirga sp.]MDN5367808.1 hypothetical protein [Thermovirga sp.]HCD71431.1 hypothetical protein [Thermovirga lienii]